MSRGSWTDVEVAEINTLLKDRVEGYVDVTYEDLVGYFDGPAPSGDETTLDDVLGNRWLLIHELVEMSELKQLGLEVTAQVLTTHPIEVDRAHLAALSQELRFASEGGDHEWVRKRLQGVRYWLEDNPPEDIRSGCLELLKLYSGQV